MEETPVWPNRWKQDSVYFTWWYMHEGEQQRGSSRRGSTSAGNRKTKSPPMSHEEADTLLAFHTNSISSGTILVKPFQWLEAHQEHVMAL